MRMPRSSESAEMSTTELGAGRSPSEGKKSVPPDRICPPCSASVWTASASVLGLKYKLVDSPGERSAEGRSGASLVNLYTNGPGLYRTPRNPSENRRFGAG